MTSRAMMPLAMFVLWPGAASGTELSDRDYAELLQLYARGQHAAAVTALGRWSDADLSRIAASR
jgi:hypothetical protein